MVYDIDDFSEEATVEQNLVGYVDLHVHDIVTAQEGKLVRPLRNSSGTTEKLGTLIITGEERKRGTKALYSILFEGENFAPEYIFYRLSRLGLTGDYLPIIESETSQKPKGGNKHVFKEVEVHKSALIQDDETRKAMIEIFQWDYYGAHKSLGKKEFVIADLMQKAAFNFPGGTLRTLQCEVKESHTFLDYILNGLEIALTIAIDFTGSNGHPSDPSSLHYFDLEQNQYLQAITNVGQILENYDSDKKFSVFGFGATVRHLMPRTSHCFALNGNIFDPEIPTLQGVIESYKKALKQLSFDGPTYFSGILNYMNRMVEYETITKKQNKYYILLIITDGMINDMENTIDQIVRATALPISIIIVGVGNEDFSAMDILDADEVPLYSKKMQKKMERDIVQFVPFRDYKANVVELAKQTLEEIPRQLTSYMNNKGIKPVKHNLINPYRVDFFDSQKEQFISAMMTSGFSREKIEEILNKGLPEFSVDLFKTHAFNPYFRNPLTELNAIYKQWFNILLLLLGFNLNKLQHISYHHNNLLDPWLFPFLLSQSLNAVLSYPYPLQELLAFEQWQRRHLQSLTRAWHWSPLQEFPLSLQNSQYLRA
eukprot:TRINITY_DN752_c0_g1_i16.p2 TRINITY_DN752_c0_g1~~TRINITY_DN752_c0_g1_i16.p2  ORF type:complete len:598 (-),score=47.76 TRINITY_DN752_c0_g1_i16:5261-7054(-)